MSKAEYAVSSLPATAVDSSDDVTTADKELGPKPVLLNEFPEGGTQAWLTVAGAFACLFCSFGWINTAAVFQNYYKDNLLAQYDSSTIAWIPSFQAFFLTFSGPFVGKVFDDFGPRVPIIAGALLHVFGLIMLSLSTQYYQIILSQGVCSSIGAALVFYPGTSSTATWFLKKRGTALGIVASGASAGGVILPIALFRLIQEVGFPWAVRICAFIILGLLVFATATVKSRIRPTRRPFRVTAFFTPFRQTSFCLLAVSFFLFIWGMFVPFTFIVEAAASVGVNEDLSNYLVPILNATSIFGRIIPNFIGDRLGPFNVMVVMSACTAVFDLVLWLPASSSSLLIAYAALLGISTGAAISLTPVLCARISKLDEIGVRTGVVYAFASFAALTAPPIGGAILHMEKGSFKGTAGFAGASAALATAVYVATRLAVGGRAARV